jgi:hypothetical protein
MGYKLGYQLAVLAVVGPIVCIKPGFKVTQKFKMTNISDKESNYEISTNALKI